MSRHHMLPPIISAPPPKLPKIEKKRRTSVSMLSAFDEIDETDGTSSSSPAMPLAAAHLAANFPEIEGAERKPPHPQGRLSQGTLTVLLRAQEYEQ